MRLFATVSVLALAVSPALAGNLDPTPVTPEPVMVAPPPPPPSLWVGPYAGAQLGYGWADAGGTDGDGIIGGLNAGYLGNYGKFVYGVEGDYDWSDIQFNDDAGDISSIGRLKVKGGYDLGRTLVYGVAGAAYADAKILGDDYSDWGWAVGAGVSYLVTENVVLSGEALYHQFDEFDDSNVDVDATTLTARVSYKF